jgi:NitT/TauT family transport system substrate-binding protein
MRKLFISALLSSAVGCGGNQSAPAPQPTTPGAAPQVAEPQSGEVPSFSLAWSEYPSWSTFGVAHDLGLLNGAKGEQGEIEKKWNIDVVLKEADYDTCITLYGSGQVDAAALTNMDALPASLTKKTVGIIPTSTSYGADALLVTEKIKSLDDLKGKSVYGLSLTVSEYTFVRNVGLAGAHESDFKFTNMDPAAAAIAMQQKQEGYDAIVVWNPFVMETLKKRSDVRVLFDSSSIPGEIIDMVVASQEALDKPGGDRFAHAIIDAFYAVSARIEDPETRTDTLVALGEKFSHLGAEDMEIVVQQTRFFKTATEGIENFESENTPTIMNTVIIFEEEHEMVKTPPIMGYGTKEFAPEADFRFDPSYMKAVRQRGLDDEAKAVEAEAAAAAAAEQEDAEAALKALVGEGAPEAAPTEGAQ